MGQYPEIAEKLVKDATLLCGIPDDLLAYVFDFVVEVSERKDRSPLVLSQVSHRFRYIALGTSSLWSSIRAASNSGTLTTTRNTTYLEREWHVSAKRHIHLTLQKERLCEALSLYEIRASSHHALEGIQLGAGRRQAWCGPFLQFFGKNGPHSSSQTRAAKDFHEFLPQFSVRHGSLSAISPLDRSRTAHFGAEGLRRRHAPIFIANGHLRLHTFSGVSICVVLQRFGVPPVLVFPPHRPPLYVLNDELRGCDPSIRLPPLVRHPRHGKRPPRSHSVVAQLPEHGRPYHHALGWVRLVGGQLNKHSYDHGERDTALLCPPVRAICRAIPTVISPAPESDRVEDTRRPRLRRIRICGQRDPAASLPNLEHLTLDGSLPSPAHHAHTSGLHEEPFGVLKTITIQSPEPYELSEWLAQVFATLIYQKVWEHFEQTRYSKGRGRRDSDRVHNHP